MDKTQLQLRIEISLKYNTGYSANTHFIDLKGYGENLFSSKFLSEDDIKTGRPAVQARLAYMDFGKVYCDILNKYRKKEADEEIERILIRNSYLMTKVMTKAVIKTTRRKTLSNLFGKNIDSYLHKFYNFIDNAKNLVDDDKAHEI